MNTQQKEAVVTEIAGTMENAVAAFLVDYKGCDTASLTALRRELQPGGASMAVVKNTLLRRAVANTPAADWDQYLAGPTALVWSDSDAVLPAKLLAKFQKANVNFQIKAGFVEGQVVDAAGVEQLASLPSKEELYAKLLALMNAPATQLLRMMNAPAQTLVRLLDAWREEKEKRGA